MVGKVATITRVRIVAPGLNVVILDLARIVLHLLGIIRDLRQVGCGPCSWSRRLSDVALIVISSVRVGSAAVRVLTIIRPLAIVSAALAMTIAMTATSSITALATVLVAFFELLVLFLDILEKFEALPLSVFDSRHLRSTVQVSCVPLNRGVVLYLRDMEIHWLRSLLPVSLNETRADALDLDFGFSRVLNPLHILSGLADDFGTDMEARDGL